MPHPIAGPEHDRWRRGLPRRPRPEWKRCKCGEMAVNHHTDGTCPAERSKKFRAATPTSEHPNPEGEDHE